MNHNIVNICSGIGIINSFAIFEIGKETNNDNVKVHINELIKMKFIYLFPQILLNIINTMQLNGIAYI